MSSADFCLIIQTITDVDAVVFRHFFLFTTPGGKWLGLFLNQRPG